MIISSIILRVATALVFISISTMQHIDPKKPRKTGKYPLQVHNMYRDRILKKTPKTAVGEWSAWSLWTPCSRSCGGGVTQQTRHCISRPAADLRFLRRQRRRRRQANGCVGLYKRIHLCNKQDCPLSSRDFRYEQCIAFNSKMFKGKMYHWEPFMQDNDECSLNCRPLGMNFYATLNRTVIDGTSCNHPVTVLGTGAPRGTRGVCIDGHCKSVNANGIIGSIDDGNPQECSACLKGTCRSINGLYTRPDLPPGYSLVAQIPQGACRVLVQQLKHTRNFLALRNANSSFIINGDYKITNSRIVEGAGTRFTYTKQDGTGSLETISSPGPLANPVDIMIVNYQSNPGIKYGYALSIDQDQPHLAPPLLRGSPPETPPPSEPRRPDNPFNGSNQRDEARPAVNHRRTRLRRRYSWKISGVTACSKPCGGGGIQATVVTCVREHTQSPVLDRRCAHLPRPVTQPIRCNVKDCAAQWNSHWTPCSVTCGEGVHHYTSQCQQELSTGRTIPVNDALCLRAKPLTQSKSCVLDACENISDNELPRAPEAAAVRGANHQPEWTVGPWSTCSVSCGTGHRKRTVTCPSAQCHPESRPKYAEYCHNSACLTQSNDDVPSSSWLLTDWSQCSENCGTGTQRRYAVCAAAPNNNACETKPELSRACSSDKQCGSAQWFSGPWSACSESCGATPTPSKQKRDVLCIVRVLGKMHVTNEMTCQAALRPAGEQLCSGERKLCEPQWFAGEWGGCDGCPNGWQKRDVKCMDVQEERPSNGCRDEDMPLGRRQCTCHQRRGDEQQPPQQPQHRERYKPVQDQPADHGSCVDQMDNCYLAVQARLCKYAFYTHHCCVSCKRAQQDLLE